MPQNQLSVNKYRFAVCRSLFPHVFSCQDHLTNLQKIAFVF